MEELNKELNYYKDKINSNENEYNDKKQSIVKKNLSLSNFQHTG